MDEGAVFFHTLLMSVYIFMTTKATIQVQIQEKNSTLLLFIKHLTQNNLATTLHQDCEGVVLSHLMYSGLATTHQLSSDMDLKCY